VTVRDAGRERVRRRALLLVGTLAGVLVLAGLLPWVTGGDSTIRFLALPLLLAGLMVTGLAIRFAVARPPTPVTPVERGCDGCACGLSAGGCATTDATATTDGTAGAGGARGDVRADAS
jgi:hypothetical protein